MKKYLIAFMLTVCLLFSACASADDTDSEDLPDDPITSVYNEDFAEENFDQEFLDFFDMSKKIIIEIEIADEELAKMQADYENYSARGSKSPIYRMCNVKISTPAKEYTYSQVGVRMKGNTSLRNFYREGEGIVDMIHYKLSFTETFSKAAYYGSDALVWSAEDKAERDNRTFLGMKKLDLKWNKNFDPTFIKEPYANIFYRDSGILAPYQNLAQIKLDIDGTKSNMGVFTAMEVVDEAFLERRIKLSERGGDLYKCAYPTNFTQTDSMGAEDEDSGLFYTYDIKTNKKTTQHEKLKTLINFLKGSKTTVAAGIESYVDMDYFARFEAVNYLLGNPDDIRNNYNNLYIYFLKASGKMIFIPYDCDRVFGITKDWNPTEDAMTSIQPFTRQRGAGGSQENPLYTKTLLKEGTEKYILMYKEYLQKFVDSEYLTLPKFTAAFNAAKNNYQYVTFPEISAISGNGVQFSLASQTNLNRTDINVDFNTYITLKKQTLLSNIDNH